MAWLGLAWVLGRASNLSIVTHAHYAVKFGWALQIHLAHFIVFYGLALYDPVVENDLSFSCASPGSWLLRFWNVFRRFWTVLERNAVSDLGFGLGNNPRRQVFEETGIWRLH